MILSNDIPLHDPKCRTPYSYLENYTCRDCEFIIQIRLDDRNAMLVGNPRPIILGSQMVMMK